MLLFFENQEQLLITSSESDEITGIIIIPITIPDAKSTELKCGFNPKNWISQQSGATVIATKNP